VNNVGWQKLIKGLNSSVEDAKSIIFMAGPMLFVTILAASGVWVVGKLIFRNSGPFEFALYSVGMQWFALAMFIPGLLSRVLLPRIVRIQHASADAVSLTKQVALWAVIFSAVVVLSSLFLGERLMSFYGDEFKNEGLVLAAFLAIAVVAAPSNILGNHIVARDRQGKWLGITALWFVILVLCTYVGLEKGAISAVFSYSLAYAYLVWAANRAMAVLKK
jgi:O-antigen/teichoic acid export membrane protein